MSVRLLAIGFAPATVLALAAATPAGAQAPGNARAGLELARSRCAECHAVERGNRRSIQPAAPALTVVANSPGMSARALAAVLQTSHRDMPDIMLAPDERADIVAYILSLKGE
jgi:mono/diheme cytochrome c family protein